jgi:kinesin family protein 2/24
VSFFEIYGPKCQDLLNGRAKLNVREDGKGEVHVAGLEVSSSSYRRRRRGRRNRDLAHVDTRSVVVVSITYKEFCVGSASELLEHVARGNRLRTTQATETNDTSSRSHAICQVVVDPFFAFLSFLFFSFLFFSFLFFSFLFFSFLFFSFLFVFYFLGGDTSGEWSGGAEG